VARRFALKTRSRVPCAFTAAMALRLADAVGTEPGMQLDLQQQYDLWHQAKRNRPKVGKFFRAA
jgi:plasmid maintenance system antidote protein VapI